MKTVQQKGKGKPKAKGNRHAPAAKKTITDKDLHTGQYSAAEDYRALTSDQKSKIRTMRIEAKEASGGKHTVDKLSKEDDSSDDEGSGSDGSTSVEEMSNKIPRKLSRVTVKNT